MPGRVASPVFVGRRQELATLIEAVEGAADRRPSLVLVDGEAGIGKSRLIRELVDRVGADAGQQADGESRAGSVLVLEGSCVALGEGGLPFAPIVEVLRSLLGQMPRDELSEAVGSGALGLARLVPELSDEPELKPSPFQQGGWVQARIFEGFLGMLGRLGEPKVVLLVIEDLHWADQSTRDLLTFVARNVRTERLAIVATVRTDDLDRRHPALAWLAEIERLPRVDRVGLARFGRDELVAQLEGILGGQPSAALVESILGRSDGNPFFAEEIVAAGGVGERLPTTLREVLLVRVSGLSAPAQALLRAAAAAGRRVDPDLLAEVAGMTEPELEAALREAIAAQLLIVESAGSPAGSGQRYVFRHALVQEAVYDDLLPSERRRLHAALAEALERHGPSGEADGASRMTELAHHWNAADDPPRALVASLAAARRSASEYAFAAAGRHYERVLQLWPSVPDAPALVGQDLPSVLSEASVAVALAGQATRSLALAREAMAAFDVASDPERAALLEERLAWAATEFGDLELASTTLVSAVARIETAGPSPVRARVLTSFARNRYVRGLDGVVAAAERAIEAARAVAASDAEADALVTLGGGLRDIGDPVGAISRLEEAIAIARDIGDTWELGRAYDQLAGAIDESGDIEGAIELTRAGFEEARRLGVGRAFSPKHLAEQAWRLLNVGRWDEARDCLDEAALLRPEGIMRLLYCTTAGLLATISGERDIALSFLTEARALAASLREPRWTAWLQAIIAQGDLLDCDPEAARREVIEGLAGSPRIGEISYLCRHGSEAEADLAELGRAQRRPADVEAARARAGDLLARSRALVASFPDPASPTLDVLTASLAVVEAEMTRLEGSSDPVRWALAAQLWTGVHQPYETAYARYREGEALLAEGHRRGEAESALRAAHKSLVALGARPLSGRVEALGRRARIELSASEAAFAAPTAAEGAPPPDSFGLTGREREVLGLLAEGRTNRQIGDALFISASTAGVHVSNILGKLGVTSRVEAATIAVRLGLAG